MIRFLLYMCFVSILLSCSDTKTANEAPAAAENEDDAARNFIRSILDQDFEKARTLVVNDSLNLSYLHLTERSFERMSKQEKYNYKAASIQNYNTRSVDDSTIIVYYANSYKRKDDSLKLIRQNGDWLVDLKYTFPPTKEVNNP